MRATVLAGFGAIGIMGMLLGCETSSTTTVNPRPGINSVGQTPSKSNVNIPPIVVTTQPTEVVAELLSLQITRRDLDQLLYETYGLRMMFDIIELDIAKENLHAQNKDLLPEDVQRERQSILSNICGSAPQSQWDNLFNQFLQRERLTRAEFDVKIVQEQACLRKLVEPLVRGKVPEAQVKSGFEEFYGGQRRIADIEVHNAKQASDVIAMLDSGMAFETVAAQKSTNPITRDHGGELPPFSAQTVEVPEVIRINAFSLKVGERSGILVDGNVCHVIKMLEQIEPKLVKYEDRKDFIRQKIEDRLIDDNIKKLREVIKQQAQSQVKIKDPVLQAQWDALLAPPEKITDRNAAERQMNDARAHAATLPAGK